MWGIFIVLFLSFPQQTKERPIKYNGSLVMTSYDVDDNFLGTYSGRKSGFLELNADGTGTYKYDIFGFALPDCEPGPIDMEWGFLIDDVGDVVKFERDYGFSYPILLRATSESSFQGCRTQVMLDFIIEQNGTLSVSSSDDWTKN